MNRVLLLIILLISCSETHAEPVVLAFHRSPPYSDLSDTGKPIGMDMEISTAVAKQMEVELSVLTCPLIRCLILMKEGQADLILGLIKNPEREEFMAYVHPPYYTIEPAFAFYKRRGSNVSVDSYSGLAESTIAVTRGGAYFGQFDQDITLNKMETLSVDNQLNLLIKDRVELVIGVESTLDYTIGALGLSDKVAKVAYRAHIPISAFMAVSRKSKLMDKMQDISQTIVTLKQRGTLGKILTKYNIKDIDLNK